MKAIKFPLFWKFAFAIILVVFIFGTINVFILWKSVYHAFENEIDKRCIVLSSIVAEKALTPIVYENEVGLYSVMDEIQNSDKSIAYIFITDSSGNVLAKTFRNDVPLRLISANSLQAGNYNIKTLDIVNYEYSTVHDIAYPIIEGDIGIVRLGLIEDSIRSELNQATKTLLIMIIIFLFIGLFGAFAFSYLITSPIKTISLQAQQVNLDSINMDIQNIKYRKYKQLFNLYFSDELDILVSKFSEMLIRLNNNYAELQKTRDSFVQAEKMAAIGTLAAGIGHEINNPISGIKNCAIRIAKNPDHTAQTIKYIGLIEDATDKIEDVTRHLLDFSRKQETNYIQMNPAEFLENSISLIGFKAQKAQVQILRNFQKGLSIKGSPNHLEQVILNLLLNSLDAIAERKSSSPDFQGKINISMRKHYSVVRIQIEDNGIGIPDDTKRKLFDPFFTTKEAGKGTGLGLYVSFNIIKEHQGKIDFTSTAGKGTVFTIELNENKI